MEYIVDKVNNLEELMLRSIELSTEVKMIHEAANIKLLNPGQIMDKYIISIPLHSKEEFKMFDEKLKLDPNFQKDIVS